MALVERNTSMEDTESATITLWHVQFDDGSFLHGRQAHDYFAYYFYSRDVAHYAGEGFAREIKDELGVEITYSVKSSRHTLLEAATLMSCLAKRLGALDD